MPNDRHKHVAVLNLLFAHQPSYFDI